MGNCNFQYINDFNFIYSNHRQKNAFKNNIENIIEFLYIKNIYNRVETRFNNNEDNYIFNYLEEIINEVFKYIQFMLLPCSDVYGFANISSFDIYIYMYDDFETN